MSPKRPYATPFIIVQGLALFGDSVGRCASSDLPLIPCKSSSEVSRSGYEILFGSRLVGEEDLPSQRRELLGRFDLPKELPMRRP